MTRPNLDYDLVEEILARLRTYRSPSCKGTELSEMAERLEGDKISHPREYARAYKLWRILYAGRKERESGLNS